MDIKYPLMVVATAERKMVVVNLTNPDRIYATINSPLKYQSRSVACFPDQQGFCLGSIEGRVAVHHVHDRDSSKNFAFKCHRDNQVGMRFTHPPHTQTNALAHTSTPLPPRLSSPLHLAVVIMDPIAYFPLGRSPLRCTSALLLAGHLRCQSHRLPPDLWHLRHHRLRRHLQLLGQGLTAAPEGFQQVQPVDPMRRVQSRWHDLRLRRLVRLEQRLRALQPAHKSPAAASRPGGGDQISDDGAQGLWCALITMRRESWRRGARQTNIPSTARDRGIEDAS